METTPVKIDKTIAQLINANGVDYIAPAISQIVHEAYLDAGLKNTSDEDKLLLVGRFTKEVKEYYGYLTGAEIRKAIHNGILGRYGEYMGINLRTLCKFLDKYMESPERVEFVTKRNNAIAIQDTSRLLAENGTRTEEDRTKAFRAMINFNYIRWKWTLQPTARIVNTARSNKLIDSTGVIRQQLIKDGLMSEDETIIQAYTRFFKEKKRKLYDL